MASTFKLKGLTTLDLKDGDKIDAEIEGLEKASVLVIKLDGQVHAMTARCTHYGAPLVKGVLAPDGRITCPWHGACFNTTTGDVEDAPAPNGLIKFDIFERDGAVYIKGDEASIKGSGRTPVSTCSVQSDEHVVVVGSGSGAFGTVESLRENGYKGRITIVSTEPNLPIDRTKLSKALIPDVGKILLRPESWYSSVSIDSIRDEVTGVDFEKKIVKTASGKDLSYTKLVLATGGIPRRLPLPGFNDLDNVFLLRQIPDVQQILRAVGDDKNKNIVVIGSSFIGMEVGNCLSKGNKVTIVGMESAPLERVMGTEVGKVFQSLLEKNGVKFYMSASVEKATAAPNSSRVGSVHLKDGTELTADLVILGVGVRPATDYLKDNPAVNLEQDGSLKTDESFAVAGLNDVYAIGDIATYPYHGAHGRKDGEKAYVRIEHWNVAQNSGRSVGRSIATKHTVRHKPFVPIFWSALGAQLRYCGNTANGYDDIVIKGDPGSAKFAAFYTAGDKVVAVASMQMDPLNSKCAELLRRGNMPGKKDLENGVDPLQVDLPGTVAI